MSTVRAVLDALAEQEVAAGRGEQFRALEPFLSPDRSAETGYAATAANLGLSENAAAQAVSRLRKRFRFLLRKRIADTLGDPNPTMVDDELASLRSAL